MTMFTTLSTLTFVGAIILAAATGHPPPDLTGIAAIITAGVGVVAFLASLYRGRKNNQKVGEIEDAAEYVKGIDTMTKRLRDEVSEIRDEHHKERSQWLEEKAALEAQLAEVRKELNSYVIENYKLRSELASIKEQIKSVLGPEQYEELIKNVR